MLKRKIALTNGPQLSAAEDAISVPFADEDMYTLTEHALAHVVFGSDAHARDEFARAYASALSTEIRARGLIANETAYSKILNLVEGVITHLDGERVSSLWGVHYPGSVSAYMRRFKKDCGPVEPETVRADIVYALGAARTGYVAEQKSPAGPVLMLASEALGRVRGRSFPHVLTVGRWYIKQAIKYHGNFDSESSGEQNDMDERLTIFLKLLEKFDVGKGPKPVSDPPKSRLEEETAESQKMALDLFQGNNVEDIEKGQDAAVERMHETIRSASENKRDPQATMRELVGESLSFLKPKKNSAPSLAADDIATAEHLRSLFIREMGKRRARLADQGLQVDIAAFIQRRISGSSEPVFLEEASSRGFNALLVLDRSSSMGGDKLNNASRAGSILGRALDFPFVTTNAVGYSAGIGSVHLYQFDPKKHSFAEGGCGGNTPTHIALRYARHLLTGQRDYCHVFLITDGEPVYASASGMTFNVHDLTPIVKKEVEALRRRGIRVSVLIIDPGASQSISDAQAEKMFGDPRSWRRATSATLQTAMLDLVTSAFVGYLKS